MKGKFERILHILFNFFLGFTWTSVKTNCQMQSWSFKFIFLKKSLFGAEFLRLRMKIEVLPLSVSIAELHESESLRDDNSYSSGTEEDEVLKNNIQTLIDSGNAQGEKKKERLQHGSKQGASIDERKKKLGKKKIKKREQQPEEKQEMEINTNKQVPDKKAENKEATQVETQQKPEIKMQ